ncbi:hypothetical protein BCF59_0370 [Mycoplasmopsis mustelae]|uniref:Uncharacterized protein n=1 Tax=Mycoplasmopsis mustelae TaxID=171289 RepID=A0A4R7UFK7_9BACT|nr:hypothetical protein [Mycoplasmopsis mustelae]TDV24405.1 hypothetical protein BCF59_0370 [Mycoplasmopsis mustelae]
MNQNNEYSEKITFPIILPFSISKLVVIILNLVFFTILFLEKWYVSSKSIYKISLSFSFM